MRLEREFDIGIGKAFIICRLPPFHPCRQYSFTFLLFLLDYFFLEKYWGRRVVEESGAALIYGSAFATQLVLSVLYF